MLRWHIFFTLLYGYECWSLLPGTEDSVQALEMYFYRRIRRTSWTQKITNIKILERMQKDMGLLIIANRRRIQYLGHVSRGERYKLLQVFSEGKEQWTGGRIPGWKTCATAWDVHPMICSVGPLRIFKSTSRRGGIRRRIRREQEYTVII